MAVPPRSSGLPDPTSGRTPQYAGGGTRLPSAPSRELIELDTAERGSIDILIVDDEHSLRESCASLLTSEGFRVTVCGRGDEALRMVRRQRFDILLLDLYMAQVSGLEIMKVALEAHPDSLPIVMTGNPTVDSSVTALREGAWDYLPKPFSATHFQILVGRAAHAVIVARESGKAVPEDSDDEQGSGALDGAFPLLLGQSRAFKQVLEMATRVARTDASVFITGESGTGKEVIAQYIHRNSRRASRELVPVNCAAIPEALLESEMFGHVEGAFTGAVREKQGLLEVANGGTLFLDELTELPLPTQAKLLRVLQDGVVRRVGSVKTDAVVNVRFIAATNRDPGEAIESGELRKDLHYRLRVVPLHIPPLRERPDDVPVMAERFLREFWRQHRDPGDSLPHFSDEAIASLRRARWPGNVRELRNVVEHLTVLASPGAEIAASDIPFVDDQSTGGDSQTPFYGEGIMDLDYRTARRKVVGEFETAYLRHVVRQAGGNVSDAAKLAGVDRTTLYRLMDKHGTRRDSLIQDTDPSDDAMS